MQPGSHGRLAYDIRAKCDGLKVYGSDASNGYFTKAELRRIARELDIDWFVMKDELDIDRVYKKHLMFKILEECDALASWQDSPEHLNGRFSKTHKRQIRKELERRKDKDD